MKNCKDHYYDIYGIEEELNKQGYELICGCDEAGRGPMAGPLVAAGCVLPKGIKIPYLNDSKKVSPKKRDELFDLIKKVAISYHIEVVSVSDVDKYDVYHASKMAMEKCVKTLNCDYVLTDAMPVDIIKPYQSIIKGDSKSCSIAAASILAKVTRDRIMEELDKEYPMYGFIKHKGYVTKLHREMLEKYGVSPVHRKSFAPVSIEINKGNFLKI